MPNISLRSMSFQLLAFLAFPILVVALVLFSPICVGVLHSTPVVYNTMANVHPLGPCGAIIAPC